MQSGCQWRMAAKKIRNIGIVSAAAYGWRESETAKMWLAKWLAASRCIGGISENQPAENNGIPAKGKLKISA